MPRGVRPGWLLAALIATSAIVRAIAAWRVDGLWIMPDEAIYASLGESLYRHGRLAILDGPQVPYSVVYPALIGLPLSLGGIHAGYRALKILQPILMSLTAVPVYLWGRSLMPPRWALLAAALTLAVPGLLYSGLLMTHVVYYPIATLAIWAAARALEQGSTRAQLLALGALALALATRVQAVAFVPALLTAILVKALIDRSSRSLARFAPTVVAIAVLVGSWLAWWLLTGGHWSSGLGPYAAAGRRGYDLDQVARFVAYHVGAVVLLTGIVPICALVLLAIDALLGRERSAPVRAYVAVAVSYAAWEVAEVGAFASENAGRLLERDILVLAPLFFLGFALWLSRGASRPWLKTSLVGLAVIAPLLSMPLADLVGAEALPDSFSLAPLVDLQRHSSVDLAVVVSVVAGAVVALVVLVPRRFVLVLPAVVLAWLIGASAESTRVVTASVRSEQRLLLGFPERSWIDEVVHSDAVYVYAGAPYWNGVWQELFWNRKLRRVYDVSSKEVPGPLPQARVTARPDGVIVERDGKPIRAPFVVADAELGFVGTEVRSLAQQNVDSRGLTLWNVDPPVRLSTVMTGVKPDGDVIGRARLVVYDCRSGRLRLTLLPKASSSVRILRDGVLVRTLRFHGEPSWSGTVPAPPSTKPRVCSFVVSPSGLLGSTVFRFER